MGASSQQRAYLASREFSQECFRASRALRRAPNEVKKATKDRVRAEVAEPLARKIAGSATGPYARALSQAVKAPADLTPRIKVGGARKVVSGGASARQLAPGTEWGGGRKVANVNRSRTNGRRRRGRVSAAERAAQAAAGRTIYKRRTTMQFVPARPFIFPTIRREQAAMLESYSEIVTDALQQVIDRG